MSANATAGLRYLSYILGSSVVALASIAVITAFEISSARYRYEHRLISDAKRISEAISLSRIREMIQSDQPEFSAATERIRDYLTRMMKSQTDLSRIEIIAFNETEIHAHVKCGRFEEAERPVTIDPSLLAQFAVRPTALLQDHVPRRDSLTITVPLIDPQTERVIALYRLEFLRSAIERALRQFFWPGLLCGAGLLLFTGILAVLIVLRTQGRIRSEGWTSYLEATYAAATGVLLTIYIFAVAYRESTEHFREHFEQLAERATATIVHRMEHIRDSHMKSLVRFIESHGDITGADFILITEPLRDDRAIYAWGWLPRVPAAERIAFEENLRAQYPAIHTIWERAEDGGRIPAALRDYYVPLLFANPLVANLDAIGFDHSSELYLRAAIVQADQTRFPIASKPFQMPLRTVEGPVMIVYSSTLQPAGYAAVILELEKILPLPSEANSIKYELRLAQPDGRSELLVSTLDQPAPEKSPRLSRPVAAFGFLFHTIGYPDPLTLSRGSQRAAAVAGSAGGLLTLAITLLIGAPTHRRRELERIVHQRTEELRRKEALYRALTESMLDVVWIADAETQRYIYVSPSSFRHDGMKAEECVEELIDQTVRLENRAEVRRLVESLTADFKSGRIQPSEYITKELALIHRDGYTIWTEVIASFHVNPESGHAEIWGVTRDITERKRALDALRENRRFLSDIIELNAALIFVKDVHGVYRLVNTQWERVIGMRRDEVIGRIDSEIFAPDDADRFMRQDRDVYQSGASLEFEDALTTSTGAHYFVTVKFPLRNSMGNVTGLCGISLETTSQKIAEERVRAHLDELQRLHAVTIGRESRILELKQEINALRARLGEPPKYGDAR